MILITEFWFTTIFTSSRHRIFSIKINRLYGPKLNNLRTNSENMERLKHTTVDLVANLNLFLKLKSEYYTEWNDRRHRRYFTYK